jgi:hypothetical protein
MGGVVFKSYDKPGGAGKEASKPEVRPDAAQWARERLGFEPDERQTEVLRTEAKRAILNCTRQWGKSTVGAAKAVHRAYWRPGSTVLVASPTERQSAELVIKARTMLGRLGIRPRGDGSSGVSAMLPNGSRIVALPGVEGNIRGYSAVSLLLIDEASMVQRAMYMALRPMLAVGGGDLWLMSTPRGKQGFFYETWEHGGDEWFRMSVPATECPRISKAHLEEERRAMGSQIFEQEYMCGFVENGAALFGRHVVEAAIDDDLEPLVFDW